MDMLTHLANQTVSYRILLGPDVFSQASQVADLIWKTCSPKIITAPEEVHAQ
jgi:hypothetical protein